MSSSKDPESLKGGGKADINRSVTKYRCIMVDGVRVNRPVSNMEADILSQSTSNSQSLPKALSTKNHTFKEGMLTIFPYYYITSYFQC